MRRIRREANRAAHQMREALAEVQCHIATREMITRMSQIPLPLLDMDTEAILNDAQLIIDDLANVLRNDAFDKVRKQWCRTSAKDLIGAICWLVNYAQQEGLILEWWSLPSSDSPFPSYVLMIKLPPQETIEDHLDSIGYGFSDSQVARDDALLTSSLEAPYDIEDDGPGVEDLI